MQDPTVAKAEICQSLEWAGGNCRGSSIIKDLLFPIEIKFGKESVEEIKQKLKEFGFDIDLENINASSSYSAGYEAAILLTGIHLFSWTSSDVFEIGKMGSKSSSLVKIALRFTSLRKTLEQAPVAWRKFYDFGDLQITDLSEVDKTLIVRVTGYDTHPVAEVYQRGFFVGIIETATASRNVNIEVISLVFEDGDFSEYKISW
jgi:hypothetical protein